MVRDVVRDCLEKEPSDRTESDIRELSFTFCLNCPFNCVTNLFDKSVHFLLFSEALLDFMQHLPVSFCIFVLKPFRNRCKVAVNNDMHSNALLTTKCVRRQCIYHLYRTEFVARRKCLLSVQIL